MSEISETVESSLFRAAFDAAFPGPQMPEHWSYGAAERWVLAALQVALPMHEQQLQVRAETAEAAVLYWRGRIEAAWMHGDKLANDLVAAVFGEDRPAEFRQKWARLAELGEPETEYRFVRADGIESEFDVHNGPCDCQRQARLVYEGPWLAAGGWVGADSAPVLSSGCAWPLPVKSLEQMSVEQGIKPVISLKNLAAAAEDRIPEVEMKTFLAAIHGASRCPDGCEGGSECLDNEDGPLAQQGDVQ